MMSKKYGDTGDVAMVVPAAGSGNRIGGVPKQFRDLCGRALLFRTLDAVSTVSDIAEIVVVVPEGDVDRLRTGLTTARPASITVAAGGRTRQDSVRLGLECLSNGVRVVLIHDAARPFVTVTEIRDVIAAVRAHGAAATAIPAADTLRLVDGSIFGRTLARDNVYQMQTPQGFTVDGIVGAHRWAVRNGWTGTDDVELFMAHDRGTVKVVTGRSSNFKITTAEDFELAEQLWPVWSAAEND